MKNKFCFSCGSKLKIAKIKTEYFDTETGKPVTLSYYTCPTVPKLSWWDRLFHSINATYVYPEL